MMDKIRVTVFLVISTGASFDISYIPAMAPHDVEEVHSTLRRFKIQNLKFGILS